jgi:hypothetical protein
VKEELTKKVEVAEKKLEAALAKKKQVLILCITFGVDVMITIFGDFCQFLANKLAFLSNTNVVNKF